MKERNYPKELVDFIKKKESNLGWVRKANKSAAHPDSEEGNDLAAYYDSEGYLTTGHGILVSKNKKGSEKELEDIEKFTAKTGINPFKITPEQDEKIVKQRLDENVAQYLGTKNGKKVDWDSLPDSAKIIVGSMAYNLGGGRDGNKKLKQSATGLGGQGKRFTAALVKAQTTKKAEDWAQFQKQVKGYHGAIPQAAGVYTRRAEEAALLDELVNGGEASIGAPVQTVPKPIHTVPMSSPVNQASPVDTLMNNLNPLADASADEAPMSAPFVDEDSVDANFQFEAPENREAPAAPAVDFSELSVGPTRSEQYVEGIKMAKEEADKPLVESAKAFGDHVVNSFMTENIIGSTVKRAVINWGVDTELDPTFQPTQMLEYDDLIKDIPNENVGKLLENSLNAQQFRNNAIGYKIENKSREEISNYMSRNPISGFIGVGMASAVDVTSLIPVSKMANLAGLTKSFKGIPMLMRNMGSAIAENVVQDLIQESLLTQNSDIRKWDDGDILYGMVGGIVMGGVAGKFKTNVTLNKFTKLSQRMNAEKNLDGINMMINAAKRRGASPKVVNELNQVREVIEQGLVKDHQLIVLEQVKFRQDQLSKGLKDNFRMNALKQHADFSDGIDKEIAILKAKEVEEQIAGFKTSKQDIAKKWYTQKTELNKTISSVKKELKALKAQPKSSSVDNKIRKANNELEALDKKMDKILSGENSDLKKLRGDKNKFVRNLEKRGDSDAVKALEAKRITKEQELNKAMDDFDMSVDNGSHPELEAMLEPPQLNDLAKSLNLPDGLFKSVDDIDKLIGLRFADSDSISAARTKNLSEYESSQGFYELKDKTSPELFQLVRQQFFQAQDNPALGLASFQVNKNSLAAKIARATKLNELLTTESVVGRFTLNKSAIKWSDNEFAAAFYNWASPDGVGRLKGGKLSVIELQQMTQAIYGGQLRQHLSEAMDQLSPYMMSNRQLRNDLGLPTNDLAAKLKMTEAYFPEQVSNLLRDEMIELGNAKILYGDEVGAIVDSWRSKFNKLSKDILAEAKEAGVEGVEGLEESADWFHRQWDNKSAIKFDIQHGTAKMEELVSRGMVEHLEAAGKTVDQSMMPAIFEQAKKFAFGLRSKDTRIFMNADVDYQAFMKKLLANDTDNVLDADLLRSEVKRIETNLENNKARELAHRKPISLTASVKLDDGQTFSIRDLLESNVVASQASYISAMAGRIAAARNGIKDVNMLDEWIDRAVEIERRRGKIDHANFIEKSMTEDVEAVKYGYSHREGHIDDAVGRLQRMAMKYNAARLMQYTGISSIAEMGSMIPEAGYKAVGQVIADSAVPLLKSYMFGGVTGKVFKDTMYDELSIISGVGLEDISFDALLSTSRMVNTSKIGQGFERFVDNAAKATRRATGHVEVTGRRLALNSLALNYGNIALGRDTVGNILGGVSNVNLVELGLANIVDGKAVKNDMWENIMESIRKNALDEDGKVASESGKNIRQFNTAKWDLKTRRKFGEVLAQQANHIVVNPDSTTAKLWHNTWWGAMFNQFKSFANNAESKVAGHNLNQAMQGYRMGERAEFSKYAQKMFWSAALGKLSLVLYGSINNAGREDFSDRMEQYMSVDEMRDWTQALGRSSAITGLDSSVDTLIGLGNLGGTMKTQPLFDSSTIGQSRDKFAWQTTATGQLAVGTASVGTSVMKGDFTKAGKQALKMSPVRRQIGINQILNATGVD